jgi:hypothetical protein
MSGCTIGSFSRRAQLREWVIEYYIIKHPLPILLGMYIINETVTQKYGQNWMKQMSIYGFAVP